MERALKAIVVPKLRALGFKGSMPHFRRFVGEKADLLTFQFNLAGGSFVVEMAICDEADVAGHARADLSLKTVTAHDMKHRRRLGSAAQGSDHWFVYGRKNYEPGHQHVESESHYEQVAAEVSHLLESQAQQWWESRQSNAPPAP